MTGKTISHYRVLEKLGEGGMGVVYKAEDTKLRRAVALKFLSSHALSSEKLRRRFLREAQAAGPLNHPNICPVHGIEESDGQLFIVMAFIPGETLQQRVIRGPLPLGSALDVTIQIGEGLHEAHEGGVVHRDVKSANVIITPAGKAVIMDFGLALLSERSRITQAGTTLGTVVYMSPEQALGKDVDRRTDIWSLGVVLYELITGRFPFLGDTAHAICRSILTDTPQPVSALRKKVPADLASILNKVLAKRPEERYQHMDDLLVDLRVVRRKLPSEEPEENIETPAGQPGKPADPTVTLYDGHAITIDTDLRRKAEQSRPPVAPASTTEGASNGRWLKPALAVLTAVVLLGIALIWWRSL